MSNVTIALNGAGRVPIAALIQQLQEALFPVLTPNFCLWTLAYQVKRATICPLRAVGTAPPV